MKPTRLLVLFVILVAVVVLLIGGFPRRADRTTGVGIRYLQVPPLATFTESLSDPIAPFPSWSPAGRVFADSRYALGRIDECLLDLLRPHPSSRSLLRAMAAPNGAGILVPQPSEPFPIPILHPASVGAGSLEEFERSTRNFRRLPVALREALVHLLYAIAGVWSLGPLDDGNAYVTAASLLVDVVDPRVTELANAAADFDPRRLEVLSSVGPARDAVLLFDTDVGLVLISGRGAGVIPLDGVALAIDLGGDDRWQGGLAATRGRRVEPRVRVTIDLLGDDRYRGSGASIGATRGGAAIHFDGDGDDVYDSAGGDFGSATDGAAILVDARGDDQYRCGREGIGSATRGVAILHDRLGNDRYRIGADGLASAGPGGVVLFLDGGGDDLYIAVADAGVAGESGRSVMAHASGGYALFIDGGGDDVYRTAGRGLGHAASGGFAMLLEGSGNDLYASIDESFGSATNGGVAIFRDLHGDDEFIARERSFGFGDLAWGIFIDDGGSDHLVSVGTSRGVAANEGAGVFADLDLGE